MKLACLFFTWTLFIFLACCGTASAADAAKPLVLEKSGQERQLPQQLLAVRRKLPSWRRTPRSAY